MADDPSHEAIEAEIEQSLAPGPAGIGVEAAAEGQLWDDQRRRDEHHDRPDRGHDPEVMHRPYPAGDQRTEPDHVGGDGADHRPEEQVDRLLERLARGEAELALAADFHDHVHDRGDGHHRDHRREHRRHHRQLHAGHGEDAPGTPQAEENHGEGNGQPAEAAERQEEDDTGEDAGRRAEEIAVALEHREAVAEHHRLTGDRAAGELVGGGPDRIDRVGPGHAGCRAGRFEDADDGRGLVIRRHRIPLEERHEPAGSGVGVEVDDPGAERRAGEARGGRNPGDPFELLGDVAERCDSRRREEIGRVVGGENHFARAEGPGEAAVGRKRCVGAVEHRVDRTDELEVPRPFHRDSAEHEGDEEQR